MVTVRFPSWDFKRSMSFLKRSTKLQQHYEFVMTHNTPRSAIQSSAMAGCAFCSADEDPAPLLIGQAVWPCVWASV